jgi:predicted permease
MAQQEAAPPRLAEWLLWCLVPRRIHEELAGDLHELFLQRHTQDGVTRARRWYWGQVAAAVVHARPARRPVVASRITGDPVMHTVIQDVRFSLRVLGKQRGFTAVAILMLAVGIGANATIFSWINSVLLDPLPGARNSNQLVQLGYLVRGDVMTSFSYPEYRDLRDSTKALSGIAGRDDLAAGIVIDREAERAWAELVTGNFFDVLGAQAAVGRVLQPSDDQPGAPGAVVISHRYWRTRFGSDPAVVGRRVVINAHPFTIAGVAEPAFHGGESGLHFDMWLPMAAQPAVMPGGDRLAIRGSRWMTLLGRRAPGVTIEQSREEMRGIVARLAATYPGYDDHAAAVFPLAESPTGGVSVLRPVLLILMSVAAIVLLIACANLAGLLLARSSARGREMAVRLAIGAGRGRLVQQLLVEGTLLATGGTLAAIVALRWTSGLLLSFAPPSELPIDIHVTVDWRVLAFTAGVACVTVLIFALMPALQATTSQLGGVLRDTRSAPTFGRHRFRRALVAGQIALSVTLLVAAGLCLRSLGAARDMTPGFTADGVVVGWVDPISASYTPEATRLFYTRLLDRVRQLPGAESVTLSRRIPLGFVGGSFSNVTVDGYQESADAQRGVGYNSVGPDYFATMKIPIVAGRDLHAGDVIDRPRVAVISESMAQLYWRDRDPIGGRFVFGRMSSDAQPWITVVGVARNIKQRSMVERPQPFVYLPMLQGSPVGAVLHVRVAGTEAVMRELPKVVRDLDPNVTFYQLSLLADHVKAATFQQRMAANLLVVFGGLALLLAAVGSYGVLSYLVGQRRREIGVRLAVGATRAQVFRLIASSGAQLTAVGVAVGLLLALAAGFGLQGLLIGVTPFDPITYAAVIGLMTLVAMLACALPAQRAASLDPVTTLRED